MTLRNKHRHREYNCFFVTTTCFEWMKLLTIGDSLNIVANSLQFCLEKYQAKMLGYVLMPNHIHMILYFTIENKLSDLMRDFKKFTSTKIRQEVESNRPDLLERILYMNGNQVFKVWNDRFDEVYLERRDVLEIKLNYIHQNPLQEQWNLAQMPADYEYSSAAFYELAKEGHIKVVRYEEYF